MFPVNTWTRPGAPALFLAHQVARAFARLLRFDPSELLGSLAAIPRLPAALARRRVERAAAIRSESEILAQIEERWLANLEVRGGERAGQRTP